MTIEQLDSRAGFKSITITMSYDEVRDTANALYQTPEKYNDIEAKWRFAFDMIEHGMAQPGTITWMTGLLAKNREKKEEKREGS